MNKKIKLRIILILSALAVGGILLVPLFADEYTSNVVLGLLYLIFFTIAVITVFMIIIKYIRAIINKRK